ncbi:MAG: adenylosuccinate lyase [Saprospiraceae bacterium]|nr:adenylosuccinate lyase [Saprospiraceae bacterium]
MITAISAIDGRYASKTNKLKDYFSEYALIKYRVFVEIEYFLALKETGTPQLEAIKDDVIPQIKAIAGDFSEEDAAKIKAIERVTNHDVKAVEYFIKEKFDDLGLERYKEFIHFGLTSQDINNTAVPLSLKEAMQEVYIPEINNILTALDQMAKDWSTIPMLARTHGQPASPTTLGKEVGVFAARIKNQLVQLEGIPHAGKFGGATGNMNAHYVSYPQTNWHAFADKFLENNLGLSRSYPTTQIEHYDNIAAQFQAMGRINTILIDFCRDIWTYISMEYFKQKVVAGEVGSSAMPHKVNPIDFENAEGNFGIANALFGHLAQKLPISRLQRDLTDSTVLRNIGSPMGHTLIGFASTLKGIGKLLLNEAKLEQDLEANWIVTAEAIQNILRRENFDKPYEALKALTRGKASVSQKDIHAFIEQLEVSDAIKKELKLISPFNYIGKN